MKKSNGYSLAEVALVLVLFSIVMTSVFAVLHQHHRFYGTQARTAALRDAVRVGVSLLTSELRDVSPGSDFYSLASDSLVLRSTAGVGIVCAATSGGLRVRVLTGSFGHGRADSLLIYSESGSFRLDGAARWEKAGIEDMDYDPAGGCFDGRPADLHLRLEHPQAEWASLPVGTPLRAFRPYVYRLYERQGRWWLGQRLRGGSIQPIAGPFAAPEEGGLRVEYLDAMGAHVTRPGAVSMVRVTLRGVRASALPVLDSGFASRDSVSVVVFLRNS